MSRFPSVSMSSIKPPEITLDNILSGDTCSPISLADFESYLQYKQFSVENLHFLIWYQDYRRRFFSLPLAQQKLSPGPGVKDFGFALPTPARTARRVERGNGLEFMRAESGRGFVDMEKREALGTTRMTDGETLYPTGTSSTLLLSHSPSRSTTSTLVSIPKGLFTTFSRPCRHAQRRAPLSHPSLTISTTHSHTSTLPTASSSLPISPLTSPSIPHGSHITASPASQPFRAELTAIAQTFLDPSSPHAITLPSLLLSRIMVDLVTNTHPDVLLPAYEHAYDALLTGSLGAFLEEGKTNTNWEKRLYWWAYGITTVIVGWVIVLACLFAEDGGVRRAWRLWAVPFMCLGSMQMYSAYRGFCSQVWGRGGTQLRPWELVPVSQDSTAAGNSINASTARSDVNDDRIGDFASEKDKDKETDVEHVEMAELHDHDVPSQFAQVREEHRVPRLHSVPPRPRSVAHNAHQPEDTEDMHSEPLGTVPPFALDLSGMDTDIARPTSYPSLATSHVFKDVYAGRGGQSTASPLQASFNALLPVSEDGYRDSWGPPSPPVSSSPFSEHRTNAAPRYDSDYAFTSFPPDKPTSRFIIPLSVRQKIFPGGTDRNHENTVRMASLGMSTRAKMFGPERVVLDPRIRAVHRRVMKDILMAGWVCGIVLTVVVLVLPGRR